ncbi:replicative DNA helicase [Stieleria maiorica]|uniref:Replicative DNA helicase n=1 Tax=Stieleria maiorica TaxID=2795974 RepID=A0A5B9MK57_9BACT|nr:DnaB-like helicase C-terminal domain-containing protein [Stieleria maiorica]QEG01599.1 replicative DNA helicase [Stieleria maiorica]
MESNIILDDVPPHMMSAQIDQAARDRVRGGSGEKSTVTVTSVLDQLLERLQSGKGDTLYKLDEALNGFEIGPGLLTVLGAPPGVGKTALAGQMAFEAIHQNPGLKVYIANAETDPVKLLSRELARRSGLPMRAVRFADLTQKQLALAERTIREIQAEAESRMELLPLHHCDGKGLVSLAADCDPGFLVVDYIQKFARSGVDARLAMNELMANLRLMAASGWGVLCLSATSRTYSKGGSSHDTEKLSLASFKESGEIEFNVDAAYLLRNNGDVDPGRLIRKVTLDCQKNRHGETKAVELHFDRAHMSFDAPEPEIGTYDGAPAEFGSSLPWMATR